MAWSLYNRRLEREERRSVIRQTGTLEGKKLSICTRPIPRSIWSDSAPSASCSCVTAHGRNTDCVNGSPIEDRVLLHTALTVALLVRVWSCFNVSNSWINYLMTLCTSSWYDFDVYGQVHTYRMTNVYDAVWNCFQQGTSLKSHRISSVMSFQSLTEPNWLNCALKKFPIRHITSRVLQSAVKT